MVNEDVHPLAPAVVPDENEPSSTSQPNENPEPEFVYPDFNFNPPRPSPSYTSFSSQPKSTESIENEPSDSSRSYAYGSQLGSRPFPSSSKSNAPTQNQNITESQMTPTHDREVQDQVLLELCDEKYNYISTQNKMDLIEMVFKENENQFMESQLTVQQYCELIVKKYNESKKRQAYTALKRGMRSRETYSKIIRSKKDSKSTINSTQDN